MQQERQESHLITSSSLPRRDHCSLPCRRRHPQGSRSGPLVWCPHAHDDLGERGVCHGPFLPEEAGSKPQHVRTGSR